MARRERLLWWLFLVSVVAWTIALVMPIPGKSSEVLGGDRNKFLFAKILHALAYTYLTVLAGMIHRTPRQGWLLLAGLSAHAFLTEFLQLFVNRGASWRDVGIDHIGVALGLIISHRLWRRVFIPRTA
jgi:VanZ family protein